MLIKKKLEQKNIIGTLTSLLVTTAFCHLLKKRLGGDLERAAFSIVSS